MLEKDSRFIDGKTNLLLEWAKYYRLSHETARIPKEEMKEWKKLLNKPKKLKAAYTEFYEDWIAYTPCVDNDWDNLENLIDKAIQTAHPGK
jgi:hypothetical protein